MKQLFLTLMMLMGLTLSAKPFYKSVLEYTNGSTKLGYAKVPDMGDKKISYKESEEGKAISVNSDDLIRISFIMDADGRGYTLERALSKMDWPKKSGGVKSRIDKKKYWYFIKRADEKLTLYMSAQKYKIDKKGIFQFISKAPQGHSITFPYYLKRPNEEILSYVSDTGSLLEVGGNNIFRKLVATYFKDKPKFVERINSKEFKKKDIYALYEAYLSSY